MLKYKGWSYRLQPVKIHPNNTSKAFWDLMFEDNNSDKRHCVGVALDFRLEEIEQIAFKTIDTLVREELRR
jgi:hypothetical protein